MYLGVADVIGPDGDPCDHIVMMRRMPADRRLSLCVTRGDDVDDAVRQVARDLASLHDTKPTDRAWSHVGSTDYIAELWRQCFTQLERGRDSLFHGQQLDRAEALVRRYLGGRDDLFEQRIAAGRIRDGHGDLQADDIFVLPDGPRILDCIEFSDELRWGDVLNDVAFLAMDLERLGAPAMAARLLAWHREFSADTWPESLAHHFVAYRAAVRAKVTSIRHEQGESHAADLVRSLLGLAVDHLERGRVRLVLIGGLPGTGKSTLAAALADRLRVVVLRTDELRAGHAEHGGAYGQGRYAPTAVAKNYRVLLDQAAPVLRSRRIGRAGRIMEPQRLALAGCRAREGTRSATSSSSIAWHRPRSRTLGSRNVLDADPIHPRRPSWSPRRWRRASTNGQRRRSSTRIGQSTRQWPKPCVCSVLPHHHCRAQRVRQAAMADRPEQQVTEAGEASRTDDESLGRMSGLDQAYRGRSLTTFAFTGHGCSAWHRGHVRVQHLRRPRRTRVERSISLDVMLVEKAPCQYRGQFCRPAVGFGPRPSQRLGGMVRAVHADHDPAPVPRPLSGTTATGDLAWYATHCLRPDQLVGKAAHPAPAHDHELGPLRRFDQCGGRETVHLGSLDRECVRKVRPDGIELTIDQLQRRLARVSGFDESRVVFLGRHLRLAPCVEHLQRQVEKLCFGQRPPKRGPSSR